MINIDSIAEEESDESEVTTIVGHRYIVTLDCNTIDEALRETINAIAPDKIISRRGAQFAIGTFTDHSHAEKLLEVIGEQYPEIKVAIVELDL
jgi:hypothetical protein